MSTKLVLIKTGDHIISEVKELVSDEKPCGYLFSNPHKVIVDTPVLLMEEVNDKSTINVTLSPWIILSKDKDILISLDNVVAIVEPIESLKEMYEEKVNETSN